MANLLPPVEIASSTQDGPLLQGLTATLAAELAADLATGNTAAFAAAATSLVNQEALTAEADLPEQTRVLCVLTGLVGPFGGSLASQFAAAVTNAWHKGQLTQDGEQLQAWPEYPSTIAWPDDSNASVTLRWVKGQPWLAIVVVVGIVLLALVIGAYILGRQTGYSVSSVGSSSNSTGLPNPVPWLLKNWWVIPVGLGALAAAPFVVRQVRETEEAERV